MKIYLMNGKLKRISNLLVNYHFNFVLKLCDFLIFCVYSFLKNKSPDDFSISAIRYVFFGNRVFTISRKTQSLITLVNLVIDKVKRKFFLFCYSQKKFSYKHFNFQNNFQQICTSLNFKLLDLLRILKIENVNFYIN